jgi:nitrate reductase beta subunit
MIIKRIFEALSGRRYWLKLKRKYKLEKGYYALLMPDADEELNSECLRHIDDMLKYKKGKGVIILTNQNIKSDRYNVLNITENELNNLLSYYQICNFSESFVIVSLKLPLGNDLEKAISVNGITKEDVVCLSIFCIRSFERK